MGCIFGRSYEPPIVLICWNFAAWTKTNISTKIGPSFLVSSHMHAHHFCGGGLLGVGVLLSRGVANSEAPRLYGSGSSVCLEMDQEQTCVQNACKMGIRKRLVSAWMHNLHRSPCALLVDSKIFVRKLLLSLAECIICTLRITVFNRIVLIYIWGGKKIIRRI